jgi:uncharacterized membrane protein
MLKTTLIRLIWLIKKACLGFKLACMKIIWNILQEEPQNVPNRKHISLPHSFFAHHWSKRIKQMLKMQSMSFLKYIIFNAQPFDFHPCHLGPTFATSNPTFNPLRLSSVSSDPLQERLNCLGFIYLGPIPAIIGSPQPIWAHLVTLSLLWALRLISATLSLIYFG